MLRHLAHLLAALLALLAAPLAAQPEFPELTGRVVDNAEILSPETEAQLTTQLEALETQSQRQLAVVTLPKLQGYDIADFGYQLGREWGLGDAERNDGALLIVAPNDRKVRIEVGYGLEGILTDAYAATIIQRDIVPRFRDGDMEGGIVAGTTAIADHLLLPEAEAIQLVSRPAPQSDSFDLRVWVFPFVMIALFGSFLVIVVIGASRSAGRTRYGGTSPSGTSISTYSSSGSSWGSGSSFSSSSFSGGGGSFGGGGASGSW